MRTRFTPFVVIIVLIILTLALAGCERDRPAPTAGTGTPGVLLPVGTGTVVGTGQSVGTPVPLEGATATPALLRPAATTAPQAQPATSAGATGSYTIQRGDSLGSIAEKFGVTTKAILAVNPTITNPDVLTVGQQITLPAGPSVSAPASSGEAASSSGSSSSAGQVYVVQKGDFLSSIAKRFGVTLAALQQANNITNPDKIVVGQKLTIPAGGSGGAAPAASSGQSRNYTVQRGDTMSTIAVKFGVTVKALQQANSISNPDKITVGQVLKIP